MRKYLAFMAAIILIYVSLLYRDELLIAIWILAGIVFFTVGIGLVFLGWYASERMKMIRADRIEREKQAHVFSIEGHGAFFVRDTDSKAIWRALHLQQSLYANGRYDEPSEQEQLAWQIFNQKPARVIESQQTPALPEPHVDLLAALDTAQRTLIIGSSNSGKTTLLQWTISRRQGQQVIILDPHAWPNKWASGQVVGIGRNYQGIADTLDGLVKLMSERYDQLGRGEVAEGQHSPVSVFIDEWMGIRANCDNASEAIRILLTESRKVAISVFICSHSDRARPLGLEGQYDLKDGFSIVYLYHQAGRHLATIDLGQGHKPATLPGPFIQPATAQSNDQEFSLPEPTLEPDETEQKILDLHRQGLPKTRIAMQVFGSKGGKQSKKIEDVITTFGGAVNE